MIPQAFAAWFAISPAQARLLAALYEGNGALVRHAALAKAASQSRAGVELSVKALCEAMDPGSIENTLTHGYYLTKVGLADCRRAIEDAKRESAA